MNTSKRLRGRPFDTRLGENLAVLCALSRDGATATPADIMSLLHIDRARAEEILRCLSTDSIVGDHAEENVGPMLALYGTGEDEAMTHVSMSNSPSIQALRLTEEQARVTAEAFDRLGFAHDDPLRRETEAAFFPLGYEPPTREEGEPAESPATPIDDVAGLPGVLACGRSLASARSVASDTLAVSQRVVNFRYQGANDQIVRSRRIVPRAIRLHDDHWLVDGHDLDARATRSFLACRMERPEVTSEVAVVPKTLLERSDSGSVLLSCSEKAAMKVRTWPGAHEVGRGYNGCIVINVPYFRGDWLPRHVLALGSEVSHDDPKLAAEMREVARDDLRRARRLVQK